MRAWVNEIGWALGGMVAGARYFAVALAMPAA